MTFLLFSIMTNSYIDNYEAPLAKLHAEEINHVEFLSEVGCKDQFENWCKSTFIDADENAAELFFDQHGFEDSSVVKEVLEPIEA